MVIKKEGGKKRNLNNVVCKKEGKRRRGTPKRVKVEIKPAIPEPNLVSNVDTIKSTKSVEKCINTFLGEDISVQRGTFLTRRFNTEEFLFSLDKKPE